MSTERFSFTGLAGTGHYLAIFDSAGQVFDWSDNTFKALSSATTKATSATEQADLGGTGKSAFIKDVDLSLLNNTATPAKFRCDWFTDANATLLVSNTVEFLVTSGSLTADSSTSSPIAELTGDPGATPTLIQAMMLLYMEHRNKFQIDKDPSLRKIHNNAGTVILQQTLDDDGEKLVRSKMAAP